MDWIGWAGVRGSMNTNDTPIWLSERRPPDELQGTREQLVGVEPARAGIRPASSDDQDLALLIICRCMLADARLLLSTAALFTTEY